jgi:hypothetical protein
VSDSSAIGESTGPGISGSGLYTVLGRAFRILPFARPALSDLEALRGTSGGATMTTPGGAGTLRSMSQLPRARRTGFFHRVGAPTTPPWRAPASLFF